MKIFHTFSLAFKDLTRYLVLILKRVILDKQFRLLYLGKSCQIFVRNRKITYILINIRSFLNEHFIFWTKWKW